jgi:lysyl endopeptidase
MPIRCFARAVALILLALAGPHEAPAIEAAPKPAANAAAPSLRYALAAPAERYTLRVDGVDRAAELAADAQRPRAQAPRYAVTRALHARHARAVALGGEWRELDDGMALWRIPVAADNALNLAFGFRRFFLPPGAQMFVRGDTQTLGPYTDADNPRSLRFATPLIRGDHAVVEVLVPKAMKPFLDVELDTLNAGYRDILAPDSLRNSNQGSGACNVDTICPQGDAWRHEINAVAVLVSGSVYCSGQLVNSTRGDRAPLLATAAHCFDTDWAASNLIVYWKYESPICRDLNSDANAAPVSSAGAIAQTGGAQLLATHQDSDFTLLRLNTPPPAAADVWYDGWDRGEASFDHGVVIHHPQSDGKRISFGSGLISTSEDSGSSEGIHHWRVDHYELGTTEAGSSGSGLLDGSHRLRGVLSNGEASCTRPSGDDEYGRLNTAWQGGGTPSTRMLDWLDPDATGASQVDGIAACAVPAVSLGFSANPALAGDKITLSVNASGGVAPYTYAFDVDGDGKFDSTDPSQASIPAIWSTAWNGNVVARVTDAAGCIGTASKALVVQAPQVVQSTAPAPSPQALCGGAAAIEPGQRWRVPIALVNNGSTASQAGYAVFAQDPATLARAKLTLETPAIGVPALAPGEGVTLNLDYAIDAANACGAPVKIGLIGTTDARSYSAAAATVVDTTIATDCQAVTTCPAQTTPLQLDSGAYYDVLRGGNGMTVANIPQGTNEPTFFGVWYTGDAARQPTWYSVQAPLHANQANSPLYYAHQTAPGNWPVRPIVSGSAQVTLVAADKFVYSWNLAGRSGGALFSPVTGYPSKIRLWYDPNESGWGLYDQIVQLDGPAAPPLMFNIAYLYDAGGTPRWIVGNNPAYDDGATVDAIASRPTCPGCVWLDPNAGKQHVGQLVYTIDASGVHLSTNLALPAAIGGNWTRGQLPLSPLYLSP